MELAQKLGVYAVYNTWRKSRTTDYENPCFSPNKYSPAWHSWESNLFM